MANFNWLEQWKQHGRKNGHSVFDLSKKMCFHLPNSLIMPIRFIETVPDDHFVLSLQGLMRTETMNRAAFFQGKAVFSAFFVPYKQLWHNFNQFVVQKSDKHSTQYKGSNYAPVVDLEKLMTLVADLCYDDLRDEFGYRVGFQMAQLLQYCKYCNLYTLLTSVVDPLDKVTYPTITDFNNALSHYTEFYQDVKVNLFRLLAYQHIFYDFYRNKYYDDVPYYTKDNGATTDEYIDTFNVDDLTCLTSSNNELNFVYGGLDDEFEGWFVDTQNITRIANILKPHYCQYRKDLYTSLLPSTQFGAVSGLSFNVNGTITSNLTVGGNGPYVPTSALSDDSYDAKVYIENGSGPLFAETLDDIKPNIVHGHPLSGTIDKNLSSSFDVLSLRKAELLQQWKQNALRAGNMVDDNFESHYGVKPYYEDDNNVRFLGQWECKLDVNPVTAMADSSNLKLGDLGAYGVGQISNNDIDVQIKDFGVIVVCAHFASEVYYSANGLDKQNTLIEPFDFFQSEFENSGLDTVVKENQEMFINAPQFNILGYTPPYTYLKTEVDEVFGEYSQLPYYLDENTAGVVEGSLSAWTVKRSDYIFIASDGLKFYPALPVNRFYQSPGLTDSVFGIQYNGNGNTDAFGFAVSLNCKAIRPMSVLGIPIFG